MKNTFELYFGLDRSTCEDSDYKQFLKHVENGGSLHVTCNGLRKKNTDKVIRTSELREKLINLYASTEEVELVFILNSLSTDVGGYEEFSLAGECDLQFTKDAILLTKNLKSFEFPVVTLLGQRISKLDLVQLDNQQRKLYKLIDFNKLEPKHVDVDSKLQEVIDGVSSIEELYENYIKSEEVIDFDNFKHNLTISVLKGILLGIQNISVQRYGDVLLNVTSNRIRVDAIEDEFEKVNKEDVRHSQPSTE